MESEEKEAQGENQKTGQSKRCSKSKQLLSVSTERVRECTCPDCLVTDVNIALLRWMNSIKAWRSLICLKEGAKQ